jgi:hypothetical protein
MRQQGPAVFSSFFIERIFNKPLAPHSPNILALLPLQSPEDKELK